MATRTVRRLVGVYDADHTVMGELVYFIGARLGRRHCALCDITHGLVRAKPEWGACRASLPVPFTTYHRDDQPDALRAVYDEPPIVAAETDAGYEILLGPPELDACHGSIHALTNAIDATLAAAGLSLAAP